MEVECFWLDLDVLVLDIELLGNVTQDEELWSLWSERNVIWDQTGVVLLFLDEGLLDVVKGHVHVLFMLPDLGNEIVARF